MPRIGTAASPHIHPMTAAIGTTLQRDVRRLRPRFDPGPIRRDLEGLRAVAVLGVVVYHLRSSWLPGGFAGVDVFFTLSGFLITRLLLAEVKASGRVDLRAFWGR